MILFPSILTSPLCSSRKAGYYVGASDQIALSVDLMNMLDTPQDGIVFTITYEFIQSPPDFKPVTLYWLDIGGCGSSDRPAYPDTVFNYSSPLVKNTLPGSIVFIGGHLHDGGTHIELMRNREAYCTMNATYDSYRYLSTGGELMEHISSIATCDRLEDLDSEDEWSVMAYYDTSLHEPMPRMDGSLEPIMGIIIMYVANAVPDDDNLGIGPSSYLNIVLAVGSITIIAALLSGWLCLEGYCAQRRCRKGLVKLRTFRQPDSDDEMKLPLMGD